MLITALGESSYTQQLCSCGLKRLERRRLAEQNFSGKYNLRRASVYELFELSAPVVRCGGYPGLAGVGEMKRPSSSTGAYTLWPVTNGSPASTPEEGFDVGPWTMPSMLGTRTPCSSR